MAIQVQIRGGTTAEHSVFTGAVREITVDTTKDTVVVHDGTTVGGIPLLREDLSNFTGTVAVSSGGTGQGFYSSGDLLIGTSGGGLQKSSTSTGAILIPVGTTAQRPSPAVAGMIRFNSELGQFEGYDGIGWSSLATGGGLLIEGDLNIQTGTEDLQTGSGTVDLN